MNDPKQVISQLAKRWLAQYGETLGTEEIRRHLSRLLSELQKREIEQVFANWSGEELMSAIDATFDLDDGLGNISRKELAQGLCPPSGISSEIAIAMQKEINNAMSDLCERETYRLLNGEATTIAAPISDTEYFPLADGWQDKVTDLPFDDTPAQEPVKRRGRPPGAKNKSKR